VGNSGGAISSGSLAPIQPDQRVRPYFTKIEDEAKSERGKKKRKRSRSYSERESLVNLSDQKFRGTQKSKKGWKKMRWGCESLKGVWLGWGLWAAQKEKGKKISAALKKGNEKGEKPDIQDRVVT